MTQNTPSRNQKIVVKPALVVLVGAITAGVLGPLYAKHVAAQPNLAWKCSNLDIWKFEVRRQAVAEFISSPTKKETISKSSTKAAYNIDMNRGVEIDVKQSDGAADCIDLRNAINFEDIKEQKGLVVRFRARTDQPHELTMILRERDKIRWSAPVMLKSPWTEYSLPISFNSCESNQAILSIHLGSATGKISLKNLRIEK
jgi:hypothetical protein